MNKIATVGISICYAIALTASAQVGKEVAIPRHLQDGEEYQIMIPQLISFGENLFTAKGQAKKVRDGRI